MTLSQVLVFQVAVAVIAAQTRSEYTRFYQPVPSQPSNAYNPSNSQPAGYSRPQPNKYAPGQPYIYTPSSQPYGFNQPANNPSYPTGGYNNAPVYQPQASNYGPYSPVNLFIGGPANYGPYNAYPANSYQNCTDQTCKNTECCEFNGLRYVCVAQSSAVTTAAPGAVCARPKRCYSNGDCPSSHCCVQRLDTVATTDPNYNNIYAPGYNGYRGNSYGGGYNSYNNPLYKNERGECLAAASNNNDCRRPVEGSATNYCPCSASGDVCKFTPENPVVGKCTASAGKK